MGDIRDPERDQVLPTPNDGPSMHDLVIADLLERKEHGLSKYGSLLQTGNGRNFLQDIYEEILDAAAYIKGKLEEERLAEDEPSSVTIPSPTEPGFYRYSGGNQNMIFLLSPHGQWYTIFDNGAFDGCEWGYIEQCLGVYDLVKIESDPESVLVATGTWRVVDKNGETAFTTMDVNDIKNAILDNDDVVDQLYVRGHHAWLPAQGV